MLNVYIQNDRCVMKQMTIHCMLAYTANWHTHANWHTSTLNMYTLYVELQSNEIYFIFSSNNVYASVNSVSDVKHGFSF